MAADKPPFGFRQDDDEKPEEPEEKQEISCTQLHEQKVWTPVVDTPANPNDGAQQPWRYW